MVVPPKVVKASRGGIIMEQNPEHFAKKMPVMSVLGTRSSIKQCPKYNLFIPDQQVKSKPMQG